MIRQILLSWVLTLPLAAVFAALAVLDVALANVGSSAIRFGARDARGLTIIGTETYAKGVSVRPGKLGTSPNRHRCNSFRQSGIVSPTRAVVLCAVP